jgi:ATP phosphoribosyltransferase
VIRLALPTGDLRSETAALLDRAGIGVPDYAAGSRALRFPLLADGSGVARVFREKDIPVQVALGNYDAGICGLDWVEELTQAFPRHNVARLRDLGFGAKSLWLAAAGETAQRPVGIVSEYANIAATIALRARLPRYRIFALAGAAEAYPPEDADLALVAAPDEASLATQGLRATGEVLRSSVWLIANTASLAQKDLSPLLSGLLAAAGNISDSDTTLRLPSITLAAAERTTERRALRLALPDGHAQSHTRAALDAAGIRVEGYGDDGQIARRPRIDVDGVEVKVIRPQDMPQQVAIGQFDLAVTGRDVLFNHKVQFPGSPVEEVVDLGRSRYALAAIVKDVAAGSIAGALEEWRARGIDTIRVASEFPNIADHFARERHLGRYSVIPIAGASEGFVPDDAEILIEGIETGSSVRANKLTVLERFFESTNCVIANKRRPSGALAPIFDALVDRLRAGAAEPVAAKSAAAAGA